MNEGRRPLLVSAYSVNWLTTRSCASISSAEYANRSSVSGNILRLTDFFTRYSASCSVSPLLMPMKTTSPDPIEPTVSSPTETLACFTRWMSARTPYALSAEVSLEDLLEGVSLVPLSVAFFGEVDFEESVLEASLEELSEESLLLELSGRLEWVFL